MKPCFRTFPRIRHRALVSMVKKSEGAQLRMDDHQMLRARVQTGCNRQSGAAGVRQAVDGDMELLVAWHPSVGDA